VKLTERYPKVLQFSFQQQLQTAVNTDEKLPTTIGRKKNVRFLFCWTVTISLFSCKFY